MNRILIVLGIALGLTFAGKALATEVSAQEILVEQLGLSDADAALYWDGLSWTIASLVSDGRRVALDGLGAFEPVYKRDAKGDVVRSMRFAFDLGPAVDQPGVSSVFEDELIKVLGSFAWLKAVGGQVKHPLVGDEWQKLIDVFVFAVLRNCDGHADQPLGLGLGRFFPTADVDLSTERDDNERRLVLDFVADDDSPEKFAHQYEVSIDVLERMTTALDRETNNLNRFARVTGITAYAITAQILEGVSADLAAELDDLSGSRAQDHNSSRSNKTASIIASDLDDLGYAQDMLKIAAAQDHNSSRSNKTASVIDNVGEGGGWASETLKAAAQDHNSSRSNKTASKSAPFYNDLVGRYDGAYTTRAQDHNSSRSNKTASIIVDFDPSPELDAFFRANANF